MTGIARLTGTVKHYDWGGFTFIPSLLNLGNDKNEPFAEYWLGVHPQADCRAIIAGNPPVLLRDIIQAAPEKTLGKYVYNRFHDLPYLFKALDVKDMLSIQVHPSKKAAEKEFAAENEKNIPLSAPERNYKDPNHKPELMVALSEFWLLHGFKGERELLDLLNGTKELNFLVPVFRQSGYAGVYKMVMEMPQEEVNDHLRPLLERVVPLYTMGQLRKSQEDLWAARAAMIFNRGHDIDRGIFSIYLFNLVRLQKGQGIFQDAGVPHAYLEGQNVEIMASSDNVLRGGLTAKHIDVKELLKHVKCEANEVRVLNGDKEGNITVYRTTAPDFELSSFDLRKSESVLLEPDTTEILLLTRGNTLLKSGKNSMELMIGAPSAVIFPGHLVEMQAKEHSLVFKASVPGAGR